MMFDDYPLDAHKCQFQVGSCKNKIGLDHPMIMISPDYDTTETVVCSSTFLYNAKRQRSLQHFIQIEPLPEQYKVVDLPSGNKKPAQAFEHCGVKNDSIVTTFSGHYAACGFQVSLQRKQMQYQIQVIVCHHFG